MLISLVDYLREGQGSLHLRHKAFMEFAKTSWVSMSLPLEI